MKKHGYVRIGTASPCIEVADCQYNIDKIIEIVREAEGHNVEVVLFPELCVSGCTCGDLYFQDTLISECEESIKKLREATIAIDMMIVAGVPIKVDNRLYDCAIAMHMGKILCIVPKLRFLNNDDVNYKRWFSTQVQQREDINYCGQTVPFGSDILISHTINEKLCIGIEFGSELKFPVGQSSLQSINGANIILNMSDMSACAGSDDNINQFMMTQSLKLNIGYAYAGAGYGESSTDLVFDGHCMIFENGKLLKETLRFENKDQLVFADIDMDKLAAYRLKTYSNEIGLDYIKPFRKVYFNTQRNSEHINISIDKSPFIPADKTVLNKRCREIFDMQINSLCKRMSHVRAKKLVIGISGGLDSTLAILVCAKACDKLGLDRDIIYAVTMPGFGTTDRTYNNAVDMIGNLGATFREISIKEACIQHFDNINHDINTHDVTYENAQARERTQILMDIANSVGGMVIGTGDLSELALGWATYNGDHMSMYGVNASVPKTFIRHLVKWIADNEMSEETKGILYDVLDTPISPELLPPDSEGMIQQKTEDLVGPYELHDFFLYYVVHFGFEPEKIYNLARKAFEHDYDKQTICKWLRNFYYRFFTQQYKRSCIPDGPKIGTVCLSPRGGYIMPSDASVAVWLDKIDKLAHL